jgi:decaprenyl-phosphate phosphoribosyltransferase
MLASHPRRRLLHAAVRTMRPRQWIKNALVVAAAGAAGALGRANVPLRVGVAVVAFCLLASGIYAINDVRDASEDRLHPRKRFRPVAAGELDARVATLLGFGLMTLGLALCVTIGPLLAVVGLGYLALTLSYTILWRHIQLLDVLAVAGGFVLRAVAGGVAAPVRLSPWFLAVVACFAVLVAAGKRRAELRRIVQDEAAAGRRRVLRLYSEYRLAMIMITSATLGFVAYWVWAFQAPAIDVIGWRPLTIVPFAASLLRYGQLLRAGGGEAPEDLLLTDRWLILASVLWVAAFALSVQVTPG